MAGRAHFQVAGMDASLDADNAALLRKLGKVAQDVTASGDLGGLSGLLSRNLH